MFLDRRQVIAQTARPRFDESRGGCFETVRPRAHLLTAVIAARMHSNQGLGQVPGGPR
jgi:hypothetical protein